MITETYKKDNPTQLLTVLDVSDRLKVSKSFVYHIPSSKLRKIKIGGVNRYFESDLNAYIKRHLSA